MLCTVPDEFGITGAMGAAVEGAVKILAGTVGGGAAKEGVPAAEAAGAEAVEAGAEVVGAVVGAGIVGACACPGAIAARSRPQASKDSRAECILYYNTSPASHPSSTFC